MAEIAVINKDNQDYDIRDKKLADASTASTVASGDAITLKTTAGTYVEIDRNSFVSAIRDVLGASITSNTGGTSDVNTLPALTSSGALKSISTSDIASVLGGGYEIKSKYMHYHGANNWFDLNDLMYGALICYGDNPHTPVYEGGYAYVVAFGILDGVYTIQLAVRNNGTMCIRGCTIGNWTSWINI